MKQRWLLFVVLGLISLALWEISQPSRWHNLSATQLERAQRIEEARRQYGNPAAGPVTRAVVVPLSWNKTIHSIRFEAVKKFDSRLIFFYVPEKGEEEVLFQ